MFTIVTSSDMTSFVYIGDEKASSVKIAWKGKEMTQAKTIEEIEEIVLSLLND